MITTSIARYCLSSLLATCFAVVACTSAHSAEPEKTFYLERLQIDKSKGVNEDIAPPELGYLSESIGAFTLDGNKGHAIFRWNHHLEVDWHDHDMTYLGEERDTQGNKFWVYRASINHDGHDDEIRLYFAQKPIQADEGYRVFFSHGPDEHETHLLCVDANRLPYHKRH